MFEHEIMQHLFSFLFSHYRPLLVVVNSWESILLVFPPSPHVLILQAAAGAAVRGTCPDVDECMSLIHWTVNGKLHFIINSWQEQQLLAPLLPSLDDTHTLIFM